MRALTIIALAGLLLLMAAFSPAIAQEPAPTQNLLIGDWTCKFHDGSWSITRSPDGTFKTIGQQVRESGRRPVHYRVSGRWFVKGNRYYEIWDDVSKIPWWDASGRRTRSAKIFEISAKRFIRFEPDSPTLVEYRK
jgi:hypothetical protein